MGGNHAIDPQFVDIAIPRRGFVENPEGKRGTEQYIESITARDPYRDLVDKNGEVTARWDDPMIGGCKRYPDDTITDMVFYLSKKGMKIVDGKRYTEDANAEVTSYLLKKGMKLTR